MIPVEAALERILSRLPTAVTDEVPLVNSLGRYLSENVVAPMDLPRFDNSAVDGYAVRAQDTVPATVATPVRLALTGRVVAGGSPGEELRQAGCARVFTGSAIPVGADAVIMQEDVSVDGDAVMVMEPIRPFENLRLRGVDVKHGQSLGQPGDRINAARVGLLAAVGLTQVKVARQPRVSLLATGSELREPGGPLRGGEIYESNRIALAELVSGAGGRVQVCPLIADDLAGTQAALRRALKWADIVVTTGGVSVGELDFVKPAFESLGGKIDFWKVAMRPGKPFVFGRWQGKFLFGLPGNPVSAFVAFLILVRPALLRWQGATTISLPVRPALLIETAANPGDRRHYARVKVDDDGNVVLTGLQASHAQLSLATANGLLEVAPASTIAAGTRVKILRWE